jgi:hypothetical protein
MKIFIAVVSEALSLCVLDVVERQAIFPPLRDFT